VYAGSCYMQVNVICGLNNMGAVDQTDRVLKV
jgi:hypothetical protein